MNDVTILLADDHPVLREGLHRLMDGEPGLRVVGEAADGEEAVDLAVRLTPDVVVMDLHMPHMNGIDATRIIASRLLETRVLVLTVERDDATVLEAIKAGAWGYVAKEAPSRDLFDAIRAIHGGKVGIAPDVTCRLVAEFRRLANTARVSGSRQLTPREKRILACLTEGASNREIAVKLCLTEQTVKNSLSVVYQKLHVDNRVEAAAAYQRIAWPLFPA